MPAICTRAGADAWRHRPCSTGSVDPASCRLQQWPQGALYFEQELIAEATLRLLAGIKMIGSLGHVVIVFTDGQPRLFMLPQPCPSYLKRRNFYGGLFVLWRCPGDCQDNQMGQILARITERHGETNGSVFFTVLTALL